MKKFLVVFILLVLMSVSAFADHPSGWGVGVVGQGSFGWGGAGSGGAALSLKTPKSPIYWGINLGLRKNVFAVNVTGDYLLTDNTINRDFNFGWFLGLGAYAGIFLYTGSESGISLSAGARAPIGIYFFPVDFLEIFFDLAPSLGLGLGIGDRSGIEFPEGGVGADIGVRFWF